MVLDAMLIAQDANLKQTFERFLELSESHGLRRLYNSIIQNTKMGYINVVDKPYLGRLSIKREAAGKIRVFAIVDSWTQSLLKPLHDKVFELLSRLPNDGTFDQGASFDRANQKAIKYNCCYGYDLSAATDRLPMAVQVAILGSLIGSELADL